MIKKIIIIKLLIPSFFTALTNWKKYIKSGIYGIITHLDLLNFHTVKMNKPVI